MPGFMLGIHVLLGFAKGEDVDGRDKPGHDERGETYRAAPRLRSASIASLLPPPKRAR